MNKKNKTVLYIVLIALDVIITVFLLVLSIIMLVQTVGKTPSEIRSATGFIGYLQNHPTVYGIAFVLPLFILLALNIVFLVIYVKKSTKEEVKKKVTLADMNEEQKEALKRELMADLEKKESSDKPKDNTESKEVK